MDDDGFLDDLLNNEITPPRLPGWAEQRRRATPAPVSWDMEIDNDDLPAPKERVVPSWARKDDVDKDLDDLFGTSAQEDEEDKRFELEPEVPPVDDDVVFVGTSKEQEEEEPELVKKEEPVLVKKEPEDEPEPEPERPSAPPPESEPEPPKEEEEEEPKQKTKPASLKLKRRGRDRLKVKQPVSNGCTCGGSGTCDECRAGL
jgi:hypothetical protein